MDFYHKLEKFYPKNWDPFSLFSSQLNLLQLSQSNVSNLKTIVEDIERNESMFTPWFLENEPENLPVPIIEFRAGPNEEEVVNCINRLLVRRENFDAIAVKFRRSFHYQLSYSVYSVDKISVLSQHSYRYSHPYRWLLPALPLFSTGGTLSPWRPYSFSGERLHSQGGIHRDDWRKTTCDGTAICRAGSG